MEGNQDPEVLSEAVLDAITQLEQGVVSESMFMSIHALTGTVHHNSIQLRTIMGNQVMLFLIDSGNSHSFIHSSMVERLQLTAQKV